MIEEPTSEVLESSTFVSVRLSKFYQEAYLDSQIGFLSGFPKYSTRKEVSRTFSSSDGN